MVFYKCIQLQLLFSLVTASVTALTKSSPHVVYVDYGNGTSDPMCWTGGVDTPCNSLDLAVEGAQRLNSTVVVLQSGQQCISEVRPDNSTCPAWFIPTPNSTQCSCGNTLGGIVSCNETRKELLLLGCYCMTNDERLSYSAYRHFYNISKYSVNDEICDPLNRRGRLCGQCKEGFSPPVYSYDLRCVKCNSTHYSHYNWVEYIAVAFVPLTIFYLIVVAFRISATSPLMYGFVLVSQALASPSFVRITVFALDLNEKSDFYCRLPARSFLTLYGIWNLDFFRMHFCPYAILAIMILLVFVFLPLVLLILYPLSCFQKCLTYCKLNHHILRTFTDTFQGSFKDGTNGTRDRRYFAAFYLIIRIVAFALFVFSSTGYFFLLAAVMYTAFVVLIATIQPYKNDIHNKIDIFWFLCLTSFCLSVFALTPSLREVSQIITHMLIPLLSTLPLLYMVGLLVYWLCIQSPWIRRKVWFLRRNKETETEQVLRFPDQVLHPEEYDD